MGLPEKRGLQKEGHPGTDPEAEPMETGTGPPEADQGELWKRRLLDHPDIPPSRTSGEPRGSEKEIPILHRKDKKKMEIQGVQTEVHCRDRNREPGGCPPPPDRQPDPRRGQAAFRSLDLWTGQPAAHV